MELEVNEKGVFFSTGGTKFDNIKPNKGSEAAKAIINVLKNAPKKI